MTTLDETKYIEELMEAQSMLKSSVATITRIANRVRRDSAAFTELEKERLRQQYRANDEALKAADAEEKLKAVLHRGDVALSDSQDLMERIEKLQRVADIDEKEWTDILSGFSLGDVNDRPRILAFDESYCLSRHDCAKMAHQLVRHIASITGKSDAYSVWPVKGVMK
jgi:hypothetical protein